MKLKLNHRSNK